MAFAALDGVNLHYSYRPGSGVPIVFLNSLGTDFRIWGDVIAGLPHNTPVLCMDKRGHGLSEDRDITMDHLIADVACLMDHLGLSGAVICGVSVGGIMAQGLAVTRPELTRALMLCCTGTKIGDADSWNARIDAVMTTGIGPMSDAILERWFSPGFFASRPTDLAGYRAMLTRTPASGYAGVCAAIRDTDLSDQAPKIAVPTVCIAGADDLATPPELVQQLANLIPNAAFETLAECGHLPCIEQPAKIAASLNTLLDRVS